MGDARPLAKLASADYRIRDQRVKRLRAQLEKERQLRKEAEANVKRFHALLIQARVALIQAKHQEPK